MKKTSNASFRLIIILLAVLMIFPVCALANSAEPPGLIVIMKNAPSDIEAEVVSEETRNLEKILRFNEEYFSIYFEYPRDNVDEVTLRFTADKSFDISIPAAATTAYNSVVTVDYARETFAGGKLLSRSIFLVGMRVLLTLIIEGVVLFLFGFRERRSWLVFLCMNLVTQGWLNLIINTSSPLGTYGGDFLLMLAEILIMLVEIFIFAFAANEESRHRRVFFVIAANLCSWFFGSMAIQHLPI